MIYYKNMASTANIVFVLICLITLLSCAHKKIENAGSFSSQPISSRDVSLIGTAKDISVPLPLGFKCTAKQTTDNHNHVIAHYEGPLAFEKVVQFYRRELEQDGGTVLDCVGKNEGLFFYTKAHENCAISINKHGKKTMITSFYRPRSVDHEQKYVNEKVDKINKALGNLVYP